MTTSILNKNTLTTFPPLPPTRRSRKNKVSKMPVLTTIMTTTTTTKTSAPLRQTSSFNNNKRTLNKNNNQQQQQQFSSKRQMMNSSAQPSLSRLRLERAKSLPTKLEEVENSKKLFWFLPGQRIFNLDEKETSCSPSFTTTQRIPLSEKKNQIYNYLVPEQFDTYLGAFNNNKNMNDLIFPDLVEYDGNDDNDDDGLFGLCFIDYPSK